MANDDSVIASLEAETLPAMLGADDRVLIRHDHRIWFMPVRELDLFEAEGNYTRVYFGKERPVLYRTLQTLEGRLPTQLFFRASRSHLVNVHAIVSIHDGDYGEYRVMLRGGLEIKISRRQARAFREKLSL